MPIRINLLAEALAAEEMRRRDPVKKAAFGGALLVVLSLVWFSSIKLAYMVDKQTLNHVDADIQMRTNDYVRVQDNIKRTADVQKRIDALNELGATRFMQGTMLNALQQTYVPNVQVMHLRVDQSYTTSAATPAKTNSVGVVPARPAAVVEHVVMIVDARDSGANPGDQVNHFKDAVLQEDYFKTCFDPVSGIRLSSLSSLQTPVDGKPYVTFTLECHFLDKP